MVARNLRKSIAIYVRCRLCGQVFEGNSDKVLKEWSEHVAPCQKKHKGLRWR